MSRSDNLALAKVAKSLGVSKIYLPQQNHGSVNVSEQDLLRNPQTEADAIVIKNAEHSERIASGIVTADCLPIIFRQGEKVALIHAGWRGLAAGIVETVAASHFDCDAELTAVIGPAAGPDDYEVQADVLARI